MPDKVLGNAAVIERTFSFVNEAMFTIALQHRRLRSSEPEDAVFVSRRWADLQFLIVAICRLRRATNIAARVPAFKAALSLPMKHFDDALPALKTMRDIGEHIDDYALDLERRHRKEIDRRQLQVGQCGRNYI